MKTGLNRYFQPLNIWGQIPVSSNISINWDLTPGFWE
jgi:hypothetical protein